VIQYTVKDIVRFSKLVPAGRLSWLRKPSDGSNSFSKPYSIFGPVVVSSVESVVLADPVGNVGDVLVKDDWTNWLSLLEIKMEIVLQKIIRVLRSPRMEF